MNRRKAYRLAGLVLWAAAGLGRAWGEPAPPETPVPAAADFGANTNLYHEQIRQQPRVIAALGLKPGMTVVDIGAGMNGMFTFPMADALQGTGRVFAVDIEPSVIKHLRRMIAAQGRQNVTAVLVRRDGVAMFYKRHSFDLVFTNIYEDLPEPAAYFDELRPSLKKETGRLCIIYSRADPDFAELEFGGVKKMLRALAAQGPQSPVLRRLSWEARDLVEAWKGEPLALTARAQILADLNAMLADRSLFKDLRDFSGAAAASLWSSSSGAGSFPPKDARLRDWLAALLDHEGVFDSGTQTISPLAAKHLRAFNRRLLMGVFQTHLSNPTSGVFNKESVIRGLERSGYELVSDDDRLFNYFHFSQFKRKR